MNEIIKNIITETLKGSTVEGIILFGSRARGDYREDSNYDVLVIIKEDLERVECERYANTIRKLLAEKLIDIEILVRSSDHVKEYSKLSGTVLKYAVEEGIELWIILKVPYLDRLISNNND